MNGFSRLLAAIVGLDRGCWNYGANDSSACGVKGEAGGRLGDETSGAALGPRF